MWTSRALGMHTKPVVLLDPDGFYDGLFGWLVQLREAGFVRPEAYAALTVTCTVEEALDAVERGAPAG